MTLKPDTYVFMVDPLWNKTAENSRLYKEVLIDIYAPESLRIDTVEEAEGIQCLVEAFKDAARRSNNEPDYYLHDNPDYANNVYRVSDIEGLNCWYGYVYTANNSKHVLKEE